MTDKWRIYCNEAGDEGWHFAWSDTAITECPNNASHSVNSNSVRHVGKKKQIKNYFDAPVTISLLNYSYVNMVTCDYNPNIHGDFHSIEMIYYLSGDTTSADIEVFDVTNATQLFTANLTNTTQNTISTFSLLNVTQPTTPIILELNAKKNNGILGSIVIQSVSCYSQGNV